MRFLFLSLFLLAFSVTSVFAQGKQNQTLPNFSFYDLNGKPFTNKQIKYNNYLLVTYFDPTCEHCIAQTESMVNEINKFKNVSMVWISIADANSIKDFKQKYFPNNKNIVFLQDKEMKIFNTFKGVEDTPTTLIFNKNKVLVAQLGESKAADIYKHFK